MTQTTFFEEPKTLTASTSSKLEQGYSFEPICVGHLLKWGYSAVQVNGQQSSDVWLKHEKYLCLINVKTSRDVFSGMVKASCCKGRYEKTKYCEDEIDIIAMFYTRSVWPLFFHITDEDRKHVSAEPKMFTEENSLKTFERAFQKFKDRKCP